MDSINSEAPPGAGGPDTVPSSVTEGEAVAGAVAEEVAMGNNVTTGPTANLVTENGAAADGEGDGTNDSIVLADDKTGYTGRPDELPSGDTTRDGGDEDRKSGAEGDAHPDNHARGKYQSSRLDEIFEKMEMVEDILTLISERSTNLGGTIRDLTTSLEFSQQEIETLKKENKELKEKLDAVEIEDRRTQFQTNALEDKVDRLETSSKKNNLIVEGIPEPEGGKEDVQGTIGNLFDQMAVGKQINFDACFRMGTYIRGRP